VRSEKIIYAHGSLSNATCMKCKATYSAVDIASDVQLGRVPLCHRPRKNKAKLIDDTLTEQLTQSTTIVQHHSMSLRRSSTKPKSADTYEQFLRKGLCGGVIKPNVTFFGEKLDNSVGCSLEKDYDKADALLVMGTSLSV
jgi:NAD-dependent SIR2 family protein deacetylase